MWESLKYLLMVESLLEILAERRSRLFYKYIDVDSVTNAIGDSILPLSMWNIVNHLDKHDFSCGSVEINLKKGNFFSSPMNINRFNLILAWRYWNFSTKENLRRLNSIVNEKK